MIFKNKKKSCRSCGAEQTKIVNGLCEWCAAGGYLPDEEERRNNCEHYDKKMKRAMEEVVVYAQIYRQRIETGIRGAEDARRQMFRALDEVNKWQSYRDRFLF